MIFHAVVNLPAGRILRRHMDEISFFCTADQRLVLLLLSYVVADVPLAYQHAYQTAVIVGYGNNILAYGAFFLCYCPDIAHR